MAGRGDQVGRRPSLRRWLEHSETAKEKLLNRLGWCIVYLMDDSMAVSS